MRADQQFNADPIDPVAYELGKVNGQLEQIISKQDEQREDIRAQLDEIKTKASSMDGRLRAVETKAALNGAIGGGIVGIVVALVIEFARQLLRAKS